MNRDAEAALIEDCKRGDRKSLELLITRYQRPVYNAAYRLLGDREDARDVAQTVFIRAIERLDQFDPRYRFFSWIYRIAVNESLTQLDRRNRRTTQESLPIEPGRSPEEDADLAGVHEKIQAALLELTPDHRAVIVLRHFSDLSYREIGEILEIPEKTVKSRIWSARQVLKDKLGQRGIV